MKICMISYSQYEFDNRVHRYSESLAARGDRVDVICLGSSREKKPVMFNDVRLFRVQSREQDEKGPVSYLIKMLKFFFRSAWMCAKLHAKHKYDIMHFHNIPDFGVFCTIIPRIMGAKIILDNHDLVPEFYQRKFDLDSKHFVVRLLKWIEKISCRYAHFVITVTTIWQETLVNRSVKAEKCAVILNSPDHRLFYRSDNGNFKKPSNVFIIVYHGNLTEIFGVDLAIRAMTAVKKQAPHAQLHIYGQGKTREELMGLIKTLDLETSVFLHDPIIRSAVPDMLRSAHLGVDPKRDGVLAGEGLSSKCMEYHAVGIPAVVSRIKAAETYYNSSMVRFFEPGNAEDLANAILECCLNQKMCENMVRQSEKFIQQHHWHKYRKNYFDILDHLTGGGK